MVLISVGVAMPNRSATRTNTGSIRAGIANRPRLAIAPHATGCVSNGKPLRRALTLHTAMNPTASIRPGRIPAKNSAPIDALDTSA